MLHKSIAAAFKFGAVAFSLAVLLFVDGSWAASSSFIGSILRGTAAIFRYPDTQWMVFLCLGIYFTTFILIHARLNCVCFKSFKFGGKADYSVLAESASISAAGADFVSVLKSEIGDGLPPERAGGATFNGGAHGAPCSTAWLAAGVFISAIVYAADYSPATQALTLLAGVVVGKGVGLLKNAKQKAESGNDWGILIVSVLVVLFALASVWQLETKRGYEYRGNWRWVGPWDNPNTFGVLMGVGVVLAVGGIVQNSKFKIQNFRSNSWSCFRLVFFIAAAGMIARGLYHSLSRGAWVATAGGGAYLIYQVIRCQVSGGKGYGARGEGRQVRMADGGMDDGAAESENSRISWFHKNWLALSVIFLSVVVLAIWHLRQTEWRPARRAMSVGNANDFSWRNRVAAWEGELQMMAEKPWFGFGWNQPEPMYEHYFPQPRLTESAAIQMNDYLLLGATLGIPALVCFGAYLWLSLTQKYETESQRDSIGTPSPRTSPPISLEEKECSQIDWLQSTCRAGAIVLLVGFWFDGGLFKLATASTFWILLELGQSDIHRRGADAQKEVQSLKSKDQSLESERGLQ